MESGFVTSRTLAMKVCLLVLKKYYCKICNIVISLGWTAIHCNNWCNFLIPWCYRSLCTLSCGMLIRQLIWFIFWTVHKSPSGFIPLGFSDCSFTRVFPLWNWLHWITYMTWSWTVSLIVLYSDPYTISFALQPHISIHDTRAYIAFWAWDAICSVDATGGKKLKPK